MNFLNLIFSPCPVEEGEERADGWVGAWQLDKVNPPKPFEGGVLGLKLNVFLFGGLTVTVVIFLLYCFS